MNIEINYSLDRRYNDCNVSLRLRGDMISVSHAAFRKGSNRDIAFIKKMAKTPDDGSRFFANRVWNAVCKEVSA